MAKSRPFSIYLLKPDFNSTNALRVDCQLKLHANATNLPSGASLYLQDRQMYPPWWKDYFGIDKSISQGLKGAIVFVPVKSRNFALTFGHVTHNLNDESFEHDFGLKVTLNCVNPEKLKNLDSHEPSMDRHRRTQRPSHSDLTYFDFDRDNSILKSLTGQVKEQYSDLFKKATGKNNLRISSKLSPNELTNLISQILDIYESDDFLKSFPNIQNIAPVQDPQVLRELNKKLLAAFRERNRKLLLSVPDLVDYQTAVNVRYGGFRSRNNFEDVYLDDYFNELQLNNQNAVEEITLDDLKKHSLQLRNENNQAIEKFSILSSLIFDASLNDEKETFHYTNGKWYKIANEYIEALNQDIARFKSDLNLPPFDKKTEPEYNRDVVKLDPKFLCLDQKLIRLSGETPIEACDFCCVENGQVNLYHIKRSTRSSRLSHLFNQGVVSLELLLKHREEFTNEFLRLIGQESSADSQEYKQMLQNRKLKVVYGIITSLKQSAKPNNLPLFSRISLRHTLETLERWNVDVCYGFIDDKSTGP